MGTEPPRYEFECPRCDERTVVDPPIQDELLDDGCVFCDATVSAADFEPES